MTQNTDLALKYLSNFDHYATLRHMTGGLDYGYYLEATIVSGFIARHCKEEKELTSETHFIKSDKKRVFMRSSLAFGYKGVGKKTKDRVTERFPICTDLETDLSFRDLKCSLFEITLTHSENRYVINVSRFFGDDVIPLDNSNNVMIYSSDTRETTQMFKCFYLAQRNMSYIKSVNMMQTESLSVAQMFAGFRQETVEVRNTVDKLAESVDNFPSSMRKEMTSFLSNLGSNMKEVGGFAVTVYSICYVIDYLMNGTKPSKSIAIILGVTAAGLYGPSLLPRITTMLDKESKVESQGLRKPQFVIDALLLLQEWLPAISMKQFKDYVYLITNFDRLRDGTLSILNWVFEHIDKLCETVCKSRIIPSSWYKTTVTDSLIQGFMSRVQKLDEDLRASRVPFTTNSYNIVKDLIWECVSLKSEISRNSGKSNVLDICFKQLNEIKDKFGCVDGTVSGYRAEPVATLIRGSPGLNKSTVLQMFVTCLFSDYNVKKADPSSYVNPSYMKSVKEVIPEDDIGSFVHFRQTGNDYWDGYKHQPVVVYDDFGQQRDSVGAPNPQYMEIINAKNQVPFQLHMSSIPDKSDVFFNSQYILATTNVFEFKPESLENSRAVDRRFEIDIIACPRIDLCEDPTLDIRERKFDMKKMSPDGKPVDFSPDMFEFTQISYKSSGERELTRRTFNQIYEQIKTQRRFHDDCFRMNRLSSERLTTTAKELGLSVPGLKELIDKKNAMSIGLIKDDIKVNSPEIYHFLHRMSMDLGYIVEEDYRSFISRMTKEFGVQFYMDIMNKENIDLWICKAGELVKKVDYDLSATISEFNSSLGTDPGKIAKIREFIKANKLYLGMGTLLVTIFSLYKIMGGNEDTVAQSSTKVKPVVRTHNTLDQVRQSYTVAQMAGQDKAREQLVDSVLRRNSYIMLDRDKSIGTITFIASNIAIMPSHFLFTLDNWVRDPELDYDSDTPLTFRPIKNMHKDFSNFTATISELVLGIIENDTLEQSDIVAVRFPERFPKHRNIVQHFKSSFKDNYNAVALDSVFLRDDQLKFETQISTANREAVEDIVWYNDSRSIKNLYHMTMVTHYGHCGSLCTEINSKSKQKIIGLHIAGSPTNRRAVTARIPKECLEAVIAISDIRLPLIYDLVEEMSVPQFGGSPTVFDNRFDYIGERKATSCNARSTWEKSALFGTFQQPTMLPSVLHPVIRNGEKVDVRMKALSNYNRNTGIHVNHEILADCISSEIDFYNAVSSEYVEPRVYALEEAILGVDDECDFSGLSRKTSPGYPYVLERNGTKGKHLWFGEDQEFNLDTPKFQEFKSIIEDQIEKLSNGELPEFVFIDNLKDELRKLSKVESADTRNFSASPMDLTTLFKMYFGAFMTWFVKNRIRNGHTIGINPYGPEWHQLALHLMSKNTVINAGDFKKFDTSHVPQLVVELLHIVEFFYQDSSTEVEVLIRRVLWTTMFKTYHLIDDKLVSWDSSLCSGHPMTAILNCMYNRLVHKLCFFDLCGQNAALFWKFNQDVVICPHGDDSLMSVIPEYMERYNEVTLGVAMPRYGLIYTPETKEVADGKLRAITEVNYLKRKFRFERLVGGFVAPMELERLQEMVNWTRKENGDLIIQDKCDLIAREFSLHGQEVATPLIERLNRAKYNVFGTGLRTISFNKLLLDCCNTTIEPDVSNMQGAVCPYPLEGIGI